ncbi:unnamed protein product, partial [Rotaria magnacalcarata]
VLEKNIRAVARSSGGIKRAWVQDFSSSPLVPRQVQQCVLCRLFLEM